MSFLTKYQNLFTGKDEKLSLSTIWASILGVVVMFFVVATGQNLAKMISNKLPFADTTIERPYAVPSNSAPRKEVI